VNFFWSGQHWVRSAVLFFPVQEGGQGLVDIRSRLMAFRLQAAQRLLYYGDIAWSNTAVALLRKADNMGLDKHLFLLNLNERTLADLTPFYRSVMEAWKVFSVSRPAGIHAGFWLMEEPLFQNPFLPSRHLCSVNVSSRLIAAGCVKLGHILSVSLETLSERTGIKSARFFKQMTDEMLGELNHDQILFVNNSNHVKEWMAVREYAFPSLKTAADVQGWQEEENLILSFKTPQLDTFESVGKKALYVICVKVTNIHLLSGVKSSKWIDFFGVDISPRGSWRSLYKRPIDKRTGDLQWRIVHSVIATNRHVVHLNPNVEVDCLFCSENENIFHLFVQCERLGNLFSLLSQWVSALGEDLSPQLFIFGPRYVTSRKHVLVLLNFVFGTAKLSIWKTRKNKMLGKDTLDPLLMFKGLVASRLRIEYAYYTLVGCLPMFVNTWAINGALCRIDENDDLLLTF